jgi:hypothetical protein
MKEYDFLRFPAVVCLSSDTEGNHAVASRPTLQTSTKRKLSTPANSARAAGGPNSWPQKERQPNWGTAEILALINAKEKEHEASKLSKDNRDLMETATQKWTKIATNVSTAGFSTHFRGAMACKDKWQTLLADYKKISDYRGATWNRKDYFHMPGRWRKELTLPVNFCASHYREMEKFLSQRPCLNPPKQRDSFAAEEGDIQSADDLARFYSQHNITEDMLGADQGFLDPVLQHNLSDTVVPGSSAARASRRHPPLSLHAATGKEKLDNAARNMSVDHRPPNTAVRRRYTSTQSKMLEVTETQGREIVTNMEKLSAMEDKKVMAAGEIADKQLEYFKIRDSQIASTERGLVQAVTGLSEAIIRAYNSCSATELVRRASSPAAQHAHSSGDGYQPPIPTVPPPSLERNAGSSGRSSGHCINDDSL